MPQYISLRDYILTRARQFDHNTISLSEALGFGESYINSVVNGQFTPSAKRCRKIAEYFGDDPNVILSLAGYFEQHDDGSSLIPDIEQAARSLPESQQRELLEYAAYLKARAIAGESKGDSD